MARWRLTQAHYLNVPGTEWEYKETDRTSGRQGRKVFQVPLFLNPADPADCNRDGEINVCHADKGKPGDIVFVGEPTPDMEPLDEEAEAISKACEPKWQHPIESLGGQGYSQSLLSSFEKQLTDMLRQMPTTPAQPVSVAGVDPAEFAKLQEQVAALAARNAELEAAKPEPAKTRRA